jgi:hypothetical protein
MSQNRPACLPPIDQTKSAVLETNEGFKPPGYLIGAGRMTSVQLQVAFVLTMAKRVAVLPPMYRPPMGLPPLNGVQSGSDS